ncbi:MAG: hypothetical protein LUE25_07860 [Clostridiales bacterium]|nr:hypothetical protein [Clostridiales bacterium]
MMLFGVMYEKGDKCASDRYNDVLAEQKKRASECRYHKMAMSIQGNIDYVYTPGYRADITTAFGGDKISQKIADKILVEC